jgi:hypothetical protein
MIQITAKQANSTPKARRTIIYFYDCCSKAIMSEVNGNVIMSACGDGYHATFTVLNGWNVWNRWKDWNERLLSRYAYRELATIGSPANYTGLCEFSLLCFYPFCWRFPLFHQLFSRWSAIFMLGPGAQAQQLPLIVAKDLGLFEK